MYRDGKMAETTDVFYCAPRTQTGTGGARAVRREGFVPGILYGGTEGPVAVSLRHNEVLKACLAGRMRSHLALIDVPGEEGRQTVIARDVQLDPVKGRPLHVDLMRVDGNTRIRVEIPVRFHNEEESPGLKKGGVLNVVRHTVAVMAPALSIPGSFGIDVSGLDVGSSVHASAIDLPAGVTLVVNDRDFTIATVTAPSALRSADSEQETGAEGEDEEGTDGNAS